jgi:hypothetical protein
MFKATIKMDTKELIKQILIKFELSDEVNLIQYYRISWKRTKTSISFVFYHYIQNVFRCWMSSHRSITLKTIC